MTSNNDGERVRYFRKINNFTQKDLGERAGLSSQTISNIEREYTGLSSDDAKKIAKAFNITVSQLLGDNSTNSKSDYIDLKDAEHEILSYGGKPISENDWNIIKRILESGTSE
ncbi:helix-turn-helix domain-containing protein [Convivina praedatoris]|uniref:HTH cro/C1-type domain-containing protein n=1 Tax=Convivina praedatoris TaxID=2880963 RepID=A0ABM9D3D6_9LACO|nr:helix-turn-helix transcriptional regulator [Convivina sp. LMG 32447]CAH1856226.1 hypothetical protein R077815_01354 [Convivina sp. LMG 32447]CAH1857135.1 hypothetical protein LMG032447_01455 [Convivina sp. LMG 32447]